MIRFGAMSIVLLAAAFYGLLRAVMLCFLPANRAANRCLAALILVLALFTAPYIVGYAGYYDAYPWLSFFPYNLTLAIGPLLYLYLRCAMGNSAFAAGRWRLHFLPALVQLLYYSVIFAQPLAFKNNWDTQVHVPYLDPVETLALLTSLTVYWTLALKQYRQAANGSAAVRHGWARDLLIAFGITLLLWLLLCGAERAFSGLTYFQRFPFYLWLSMLVCFLGTGGYRHGRRPFALAAPDKPIPPPPIEAPQSPLAPSQTELGERWRSQIIEGAWWRDADLTLAILARRLGTNTTALSRAINEGLGLNFNEMINRMRVDAIIAALQGASEEHSVLDIALAEGFNSKASFNRAFKLYTGETPTEYRRRQGPPGHVSTSS